MIHDLEKNLGELIIVLTLASLTISTEVSKQQGLRVEPLPLDSSSLPSLELQHRSVPDFPALEPGKGLRHAIFIHFELLDHGADVVLGREGQHLGVHGARRHEVRHQVVAVEEVGQEPKTEEGES